MDKNKNKNKNNSGFPYTSKKTGITYTDKQARGILEAIFGKRLIDKL